MRKTFYSFFAFALLIALPFAFASCGDEPGPENTVAVTGVSIRPATLELKVGDEPQTLVAEFVPADATNRNVSWKSDHPEFATVDPGTGEVEAVAEGVATITVTTEDGGFESSCTVTVSAAEPELHPLFGEIAFMTDRIWTVGNQEWSDEVVVSAADGKTVYDGGDEAGFKVDFRSNADGYGDLFSWEAVVQYKDELCPDDWRVPTVEDFRGLDIEMGGTGSNVWYEPGSTLAADTYFNPEVWGGSLGGECLPAGGLQSQGETAYYWSQTEGYTPAFAFPLAVNTAQVYVEFGYEKSNGYMLRCVKGGSGAEAIPVTGVELDKSSEKMILGEGTLTLSATVLPLTATNKGVTWSTDASSVATVSGGVVTAVGAGTATITVTTDEEGFEDSCTIDVTDPSEEHPFLGEIGFLTPSTWIVGDQEWSDAVVATRCKKDDFDGGYVDGGTGVQYLRSDCLQNPGFGDMFSWQAVFEYADALCPGDWNTPTMLDFKNLDIEMGGTGESRYDPTYIQWGMETYFNPEVWGGTKAGFYDGAAKNWGWGDGVNFGWTYYWTGQNFDNNNAWALGITYDGEINPQANAFKANAFQLRCVKEK
ncbi:MAG: Ig-like domain-containing protein [Alistipes sp.]|jgi:uncharacterized protein (TIGR02145 family)|nr:Ig-like domain-containing protein [Alistipes sp.]